MARPSSAQNGRRRSTELDEVELATPRRATRVIGKRHEMTYRKNPFSELVERTVDALKGTISEASVGDVQGFLAKIRREFDEVHCEAEQKEKQLIQIRQDIRFWESEAKPPEDWEHYHGFERRSVKEKMEQAARELEEQLEMQKVYRHMVNRLLREQSIMAQKVAMMEQHLERKSREVEAKQSKSRRINEDKVEQIFKLESLEQDMHLERMICTSAISDLTSAIAQRRQDVSQGEDFENWRYDVALEAATEAFEATAGRYRKIYAIEKLTGNCLQRLTFDQAEQSQATEDGFQRIREVTGLTDVMDIVHKFLNREVEYEQLKNMVRECEERLRQLREEEAGRPREHALLYSRPEASGLKMEVDEVDRRLEAVQRGHEEAREQLKQSRLLVEGLLRWTQRVGHSLAPIREVPTASVASELPAFFEQLVGMVKDFFERAHAEMPDSRLVKITDEARGRLLQDQGKILADKDFMRSNIRVSVQDQTVVKEEKTRKKDTAAPSEEHRLDMEFANERDRLKNEANDKAADRASRTPKNKQSARRREKGG